MKEQETVKQDLEAQARLFRSHYTNTAMPTTATSIQFVYMDLLDLRTVQEAVNTVKKMKVKVDVLISNAGMVSSSVTPS